MKKGLVFVLAGITSLIALFSLYYYLYLSLEVTSDVPNHILILQKSSQLGIFPVNFLYYFMLKIFSGFQNTADILLPTAILLLSMATTAKFLITYHFMNTRILNKDKLWQGIVLFVSFALLFVHAVYIPGLVQNHYLGQITPNIWHNSTTIFLMPFALLLFLKSFTYLTNPDRATIIKIAFLLLLNVAVKPSFVFCFVVVFSLFCLIGFKFTKYLFYGLFAVTLAIAAILIQYYLIYALQLNNFFGQSTGVEISFLEVWRYYSKNIPVSILLSFIFPFTYLLCYPAEIIKSKLLQYAASYMLVAIVIFSVFAESGFYKYHANFSWQLIISSYILFMVCTTSFLGQIKEYGLQLKDYLVIVGFLAHLFCGIEYLIYYSNTLYFK